MCTGALFFTNKLEKILATQNSTLFCPEEQKIFIFLNNK